jgi:O-antigen/teichoic acid export membrane protein
MQNSYTSNYIKIYLWQGVSLILNFLSMFIVIPYLTSEPTIYGIYSVCISISIFLAYADLGFLSAGQKYAAEYFARGENKEEIKVIGFTSFVLLIFLCLLSFVFLFLSFNPNILIKGLIPGHEATIASSLLMILALFTPVTLLQRLLQMIFGIRLEDYIVQRSNIIGSLFKILSVLYFFGNEKYDIVGYFLFMQIVGLITSLITLGIARKRFHYDFKALVISIRFSKPVFLKTKNLAFTSLFLTLTWILYYELDPTVIGKFIGAKQVAIYAIGLTILSFFRSILGILYSPYNNRFNHFIGVNNIVDLKLFFLHIIAVLAPIVIMPVLTVSLLARPLILSWVGINYTDSVEITKFLVLANLFSFITYPTALLLMAQERIKEMYFVNALIPLIYWCGIGITYSFLGLKSFAVFKLIAFGISTIVYYVVMLRFLGISIMQSIKKIWGPLLIPSIFLIVTALFIKRFLPCEKSKMNLLIVGGTAVCLIVVSFVIQYFCSNKIRSQLGKIIVFRNRQ